MKKKLLILFLYMNGSLYAQNELNPGMINIFRSLGGEYETTYPHNHPLHGKNKKKSGGADASVYAKKPVYTVMDGCMMKSALSENPQILAILKPGMQVKVIDARYGNYWRIYFNGKIGYVESKHLKYHNINNVPLEKIPRNVSIAHDLVESFYDPKPNYTAKKRMPMYTGASPKTAIRTYLPIGAMVKVVNSYHDDWWEIRYQGYHGFVKGTDLTYFSSKAADSSRPIGNYKGNLGSRVEVFENALMYKVPKKIELRARMSENAEIVLEIAAHEEVKVIDKSFGFWWEVYYRGNTGYIDQRILRNQAPSNLKPYEIKELEKRGNYFKLAQPANLRLEASGTSKILYNLSSNDRLLVVENSRNDWVKVIFKGKIGYIKSPLLIKD